MRGFAVAFLFSVKRKVRAKSLEEFVSLVRKRNGSEIRIRPGKRNEGLLANNSGAGTFAYQAVLSARFPGGRELYFVKRCFSMEHAGKVLERSGSKRRAEKRHLRTLREVHRDLKLLLAPLPVALDIPAKTARALPRKERQAALLLDSDTAHAA